MFIDINCLANIIGSDVVANAISFSSVMVAILALCIGGKKVNEILNEYKKKQRNAIFGYHSNLNIFIMRLKRLISDSQGKPISVIYLFSGEEKLRRKGNGYERIADNLCKLSHEFLDYLSLESEQIPATINTLEDEEWDNLIEILVEYLTDFVLYETNAYISKLDSEESIEMYHRNLIQILDQLLCLIKSVKEKFRHDLIE